MHNVFPISSWALNSSRDAKNIRREAEELRAQYLKGLFRRLFSGSADRLRPANGQLSGQSA